MTFDADFVMASIRAWCANHFVPPVFLLCLMHPKDTLECGEVSSPHDVIDVVIDGGNKKAPADAW
jgi:hypothetical protein